jgi:uncharacterized membrane protein YfcA
LRFSPLARAPLEFRRSLVIDWKVGLVLGLVSFAGAIVGAAFARNLSNTILRRIFLVAVIALAGKRLAYDFRW